MMMDFIKEHDRGDNRKKLLSIEDFIIYKTHNDILQKIFDEE